MKQADIEKTKDSIDLFIYKMASGIGDIKSRLIDSETELMKIGFCVMPIEIRHRYNKVLNELTKKGLPPIQMPEITALKFTVPSLHRKTINRLVEELISIRCDMEYKY